MRPAGTARRALGQEVAREPRPSASSATAWLKAIQLAVAVGVLVLFWLIYPGSLLLFAGLVGLCYLAAAVAAALDWRPGVWLALAFTLLAFAFSAYGVYRYVVNGFDFLAGNFPGRTGWYSPPYLFVLVALGALAAIVLHAVTWPWMLRPRGER